MGFLAAGDRDRPDRGVIAFFFLVHCDAHKSDARSIWRNLRIADPNKIEQIFFCDVALLSVNATECEGEKKGNDEARMTNDE